MRRSAGLQFAGLMLGWAGLRGLGAAGAASDSASDPRSIALVISALIVAATAIPAALALWRNSEKALALTKVWAVLLFGDLLLQELMGPPGAAPVWFRVLIVGGIGCLLLALTQHVQYRS